MQDFHKLIVYQSAFDLSKEIYQEIKELNHYRLRDQILASSTSICANLAEMASFDNINQQKQKMKICIGEANETDFWINFLKELNLISNEKADTFLQEIKKIRIMLYKLLQKIKTS